MGKGALGNMCVFPGLSVPEPGVFLQLSGTVGMEWEDPTSKTYSHRRSGLVNTGDVGGL